MASDSLARMGARSGGRPALVGIAITASVAAVVVGAALTIGKHQRVILYGDSLAFEARDAFELTLQRGDDIEVVDRTLGGTAICDWLDRMRRILGQAGDFELIRQVYEAEPVRRDLLSTVG
jgi:hypothetical protein